ncbi:MAG TPA: 16S rRNA (adenine(1518)-N(6)/adenine(1519)-N(6))-dimethyltransferase RsmA [Verrucomicrobiae bacterium]
MNLTEMRALLTQHGIMLTKSLGQNFLHDGNQLRRIAGAGEIKPGDKLLEIGPGLGPLTELLLENGNEVLAIEKDQRLIPLLQSRFAENKNFTLLHADALRVVEDQERDWQDWKLVANLPYSVASPILVELAHNPRKPERLIATLQLEVAQRLMAETDSDDYGILTLLVQLHYRPMGLFKIPPGCFFPAPDVDSACISLIRREQPLLPVELVPKFERIVKTAFGQRRKMAIKLLKQNWPTEQLEAAFNTVGLPLQIRAEKISLEQFAALTKALA